MAARVSIYLNMAQRVAEDGKFYPAAFARMEQPYLPGDPVAMVTAFTSEETEPLNACEEAFEIGNIDPAWASSPTLRDLVQRYRAEEVRSLSVGDVVTVDGIAFACKSFGFEKVGLGAGLAFCGGRSAKEMSLAIREVNADPVAHRNALAYISTLAREA